MKKPGFTLIEMIAVMAVLSVLLGISTMMLVQLFEFQRNNDEYAEVLRSVNRLAGDFRSDIRQYGKPEFPSGEDTLLRWYAGSEHIEYKIQPGEFPDQQIVVRTVRSGGQQTRIENYRLPDRSALHFAEGKDQDAGLVALSLWTASRGTDIPGLGELDPFARTMPPDLQQRIEPQYAANWRTIVVRY